jgi:hypothetical protein
MKYYQKERMYMSGGRPSVKVVLRNPLNYSDQIDYTIIPHDNILARDWTVALKLLLESNSLLEKNFCFIGFPNNSRNIEYLCNEINRAIFQINTFNASLQWQKQGLQSYIIEDFFTPDVVRFGEEYETGHQGNKVHHDDTYYAQHLGLQTKQSALNRLHNHFEKLQGTVDNLSSYYLVADYETKYAIRQLNNLCHELENLLLSQHKQKYLKEWIRPSQITTWLHATRYHLTNEHKQLFLVNKFDRKFGHVYMHWSQIGKTYYEVFRDENAPDLIDTVCDAITQLEYYSGEFDVEWGQDTVYGNPNTTWVTKDLDLFYNWLIKNNKDPDDPNLCNGYIPIGEIDLQKSFGSKNKFDIWEILSSHLDIYSIEVDGIKKTYEYCWTDASYKQMQIDIMKPGYDFSSRR